jgi:phage-related protein
MINIQSKAMRWLGDSLDAVKDFSPEARRAAGHQLSRVQGGEQPTDWKPMETVGSGVREIRIRVEKAYRVLYVAKFAEAIYVLHAFEKKTQKTSKSDLDLANQRYRQLMNERMKK